MKKIQNQEITLKYVGAKGGTSTHLNQTFTDGNIEYTWFTASEKLSHQDIGKDIKMKVRVIDYYMDGYASLEGMLQLTKID